MGTNLLMIHGVYLVDIDGGCILKWRIGTSHRLMSPSRTELENGHIANSLLFLQLLLKKVGQGLAERTHGFSVWAGHRAWTVGCGSQGATG